MCLQLVDDLCLVVYPCIVAGSWKDMYWAHPVDSDGQWHKGALFWAAAGWMGLTGCMHEGSGDFVGLGIPTHGTGHGQGPPQLCPICPISLDWSIVGFGGRPRQLLEAEAVGSVL